MSHAVIPLFFLTIFAQALTIYRERNTKAMLPNVMRRVTIVELPRAKKYTYEDYLTWNDGKRYELIDGEIYLMSPAPSSDHQRISANLTAELVFYLRGKACEVFPAPFDVRLDADAEDDTVVQPDITVVCDPEKVNARGCKGVPDMIIEILSPSTAQHDQVVKFSKYLEAGVREYWMVYPDTRTVMVFLLREHEYVSHSYGSADTISVHVLEDCQINLSDVFPPVRAETVSRPEANTD